MSAPCCCRSASLRSMRNSPTRWQPRCEHFLAAAEIGLKKKREDIVIMLRSIKLAIWFAGVVLVGAVMGTQAQAPEPKGPVAKPLLNLDLAPEMDSIEGRVMRMQLTTYEPGASNKPHSHKDRPEVVYILSGKIIDTAGHMARKHGPGNPLPPARNPTHGRENKGRVPAVMLVTGTAKKE